MFHSAGAKEIAKFLVGFATLFAAVELIGLLAGQTVNDAQRWLPGIDKALHVLGFFTLGVLGWRLTEAFLPGFRSGPVVLGVSLTGLAIVDELAQGLSPARLVDVADVVASLCGLTLGLVWAGRRRSLPLALLAVSAIVVAALVTFDGFSTQSHLNAARRLERTGDFVGARREYKVVFDSGVRTAGLFNELGWVEIESGVGNAETAVAYAAKALEMRPDDADYNDTYGWALHHAGRSAEALPFLERAYAAKPNIFCIHYHLGEVYLALSRTDEAALHFRRQMELPETREAARATRALERLEAQRQSPRPDSPVDDRLES
jgi:VanZ family protein